MEPIPFILRRGVRRLLSSRLFALTLLLGASLALATYVSVTTSAFTVVSGEQKTAQLSLSALPSEEITPLSGDGLQLPLFALSDRVTVPITVDGVTTLVRGDAGADTVADLLALAEVSVSENDVLSVPADTAVSEGLSVQIARVNLNEYSKSEAIPFETETKYTNTLPKGQTQVTQEGKRGTVTRVYSDRFVDGVLVETVLVSETVTPAVKQVKLVGTVTGSVMSEPPTPVELDGAGQPVNYTKMLSGKATAYSGEEGIDGMRTSTGRKAAVGIVAVDPKIIPYGTRLYIVSPDGSYVYGYAIAGDTGGGVLKGTIIADLYMDTIVECNRFGRRTMNVYILD